MSKQSIGETVLEDLEFVSLECCVFVMCIYRVRVTGWKIAVLTCQSRELLITDCVL